LIIKEGEIVYEKNSLLFSASSKQQSWSISKQMLSALVGIAIADGDIGSVEDRMDLYDTTLSQNGFAGVSFRQALMMSSGVLYNEPVDRYDLFFDVFENFYLFGLGGTTLDEATLSPAIVRDYQPDTRWQYASINTQAIAKALVSATNKPLQEYLYEKLLDPMGVVHESEILVDGDGTEFAFCCFYMTSRTYAAFGLLFENHGFYNGKQIVPADWVRLSTSFDDPRSWTRAEGVTPEGRTDEVFGFSYHWWPIEGNRGDFAAIGLYGQMVHILPEQDTVIVRLSGDFNDPNDHRVETVEFGRAVADALDEGFNISALFRRDKR